MKSPKEKGWYWIKVNGDFFGPTTDGWTIAYWDGKEFECLNEIPLFNENINGTIYSDIFEISPEKITKND